MKRLLKWLGIVLGGLAGLILLTALVMYLNGNARLNKVYEFPPSNITIPTDAARIAYGKHRVETLCADCHGADLSGVQNWFSVGPIGTIDSANLTSGEGGVGRGFASKDSHLKPTVGCRFSRQNTTPRACSVTAM